jgi:hypothetical protein
VKLNHLHVGKFRGKISSILSLEIQGESELQCPSTLRKICGIYAPVIQVKKYMTATYIIYIEKYLGLLLFYGFHGCINKILQTNYLTLVLQERMFTIQLWEILF